MKFIVAALESKGPPVHTKCALCSEDPRFCSNPF